MRINLHEGPITVNAETVSRYPTGHGVRFVDVDSDTAVRLERTARVAAALDNSLSHPSN